VTPMPPPPLSGNSWNGYSNFRRDLKFED